MNQILVSLLISALCHVHVAQGLYDYDGAAQETHHDRLQEFEGRRRRALPSATPEPIFNMTVDHHRYYTSQFFQEGEEYWTELRGHNESVKHADLSSNHLLAARHTLKFKFPYYGHMLSQVYITTGGFLYLGEPSQLMTEVQFIAPLMAYFNPKLNENASVLYYDDGQKLVVQWDHVPLYDKIPAGPFTFQVTLHNNGKIIFAYKSLPESPAAIQDSDVHPVRVGVSDAFYIPVVRGGVLYRLYYRYDEVKFNRTKIVAGSAVILNPKPNCVSATSCGACINTSQTTDFTCGWCHILQTCSDGIDRKRFEWTRAGCHQSKVLSCDRPTTSTIVSTTATTTKLPETETPNPCMTKDCNAPAARSGDDSSSGLNVGAIVAVCVLLVVVIALAAWFFHAYRHPTSGSGQFLIWLTRQPRNLFRSRAPGNDAPKSAAYETQA